MGKLLPYETIVKAHKGDPDAIDTVLSHYAGYIRYCSQTIRKNYFRLFIVVFSHF